MTQKMFFTALCALALWGCPRRTETTPEEARTLEQLRASSVSQPNNPEVWQRLAWAELLRDEGDFEQAREASVRALRLDSESASAHLAHGIVLETHAELAGARDAFVSAIGAASESESDPAARIENGAIASVALAHLKELLESTPHFVEHVREPLAAALPGLPATAQVDVANLLVVLAQRAGESGAAIASDAGCITEWRAAGPFGPRELLGFDEDHGVVIEAPLESRYDLGFGRGENETRTLGSRGCAVHLGGGPRPGGGTRYLEASVDTHGPSLLRVETPNAVQVYWDGELIGRLDHRRAPLRRTNLFVLPGGSGSHQLDLKISSRHPNPILIASVHQVSSSLVEALRSRSVDPVEDLGIQGLPPGLAGVRYDALSLLRERISEAPAYLRYLIASVELAHGNVVSARETLREVGSNRGPVPMRVLQATIALRDPVLDEELQRDRARGFYRAAIEFDEEAVEPALRLAELTAAEGRIEEAIANLRALLETNPALSHVRLRMLDLQLSQGWDGEASEHLRLAREHAPGACAPIQAALTYAQQRDRIAELTQLTDAMVECDHRSTARYRLMLRARRYPEARAELERITAFEPPQARTRWLHAHLGLAEAEADEAEIGRVLDELRARFPTSANVRFQRIDRALAIGDEEAADRELRSALEEESSAMVELRRLQLARGGVEPLMSHRADGLEAIRSFEASPRGEAAPQVLVFDYAATQAFPDGSSVTLTHQIYRLQSEEAIDELGEFEAPYGAVLLNLRTIKPDGRVLEPDLIEGKDTISLPALEVGDYIESEYVRAIDAPAGIPGAILGERFYFSGFELPFYRTEQLVILPPGMEPMIDPRGPAPRLERSRDESGNTLLWWRASQILPLVQEPASVSSREFLPSVNWGAGASWEAMLEGLRDALADRNIADPTAQRLADRLVSEAGTDERAQARAIYAWVLENVENNNDVFGHASIMLSGRTGNRARVMHYLFGLAGLSSRLVLARSFGNDQTRSELPDEETYNNLVTELRLGDELVYLQPTARGIPFGYISPALRGQDALVLSEESAAVTLPEAPGADGRRIQAEIRVAADGAASMSIVEEVQGHEAIQWREDLEGIAPAVVPQRFEEAYLARLFNGATLDRLRMEGTDEPESPFVMRYAASSPSLTQERGDARVLPGLFPSQLTPRFARTDTRQTPQVVGPPIHQEVTLRIAREGHAATTAGMRDVRLDGPAGIQFSQEVRADGEWLIVTRRIDVPLSRVSPEDYTALAEFCRRVDAVEASPIPLP